MKKLYLLLSVCVASLCFTQCAEEEMFTEGGLATDIQLSSARTSDAKVPEITSVSSNGSKVTIEFTNYAAPGKPEGGFEILMNGKRTYTSLAPRSYSTSKVVKMTFNTSNPSKNTYQIYARWNSGYERSNEAKVNSENTNNSPSDDEDDDKTGGDSGNVKKPSNAKQPVISKLAFGSSKVTLEFVNFASPSQPEGGFELIVDGKRTGTSIIPRLFSGGKNLKMVFSISNPDDHCYQVYARWNSGYIGSKETCKEGGQSSGSSSPNDDNDDQDDDDDQGSKDDGKSSNPKVSGLPALKLLRGYEFNKNYGSNVSQSRDGLKVHHLGHSKGRVVKKDGEGAYHFKITPGSYKKSDVTYRQELIAKGLPHEYFNQGWRAKWGQEYVYQMRVKVSNDYDIGSGYTSFVSMKNDYYTQREGSYTMHFEGDHYFLRHMSATKSGVGSSGAKRQADFYGARGKEIYPNKDFHPTRRTGSGYASIEKDAGKWVTWTFYLKWSYGSDGFFKVYKDGELFHSYKGATSYKDKEAPYFKFGLYNSWWKNGKRTGATLQEMYVDYLRVYVPK